MNKIECIEDYLLPAAVFRVEGSGRRSNRQELRFAVGKSTASGTGPANEREANRAGSAEARRLTRAPLRLVARPRQQAGAAPEGRAYRDLLADGAYLISALGVAAVLWWTTL